MRRAGCLQWCALLLLCLLGCTSPVPRLPPQVSVSEAAPPVVPPASPAEEASLPLDVKENQSFVTLNGVPQYKIGPGDVLELTVMKGFAPEKQLATVKASGALTIDFHEVTVGGLTPDQAAEKIRRTLAPFYKQLSVEVVVKEYNSKKVTVLGSLGGLSAGGAIIPLKGRKSILDLIAETGGPSPIADLERLRVIRQDAPSANFNFVRLLQDPLARPYIVDAGDVVFVPARAPAIEPRVFILGEVKNQGAYPLASGMRLSQALALTGGVTDVAFLESARVLRGGPSQWQLLEVDFRRVLETGDLSQDLPLRANDVIVIPRSGIGNWNAFLGKIRPTLETIILPVNVPLQYLLLERALSGQ